VRGMSEREIEEALRILRSIGLRRSEALVYLKILTNEGITAIELSSELNMPLSKLYVILKTLESRGLIESYGKKRKIYRVSKPEISLIEILREKERRLKEDEKFMLEFIKKIKSSRDKIKIPPIYIIRENFLSRLGRELRTAKSEVLIALPNDFIKDLLDDIKSVLEKNIVVSVVLYPSSGIEEILKYFEKMSGCITVKRREIYAMDLLIIDRSKAFIYSPKNRYAMMIEDTELVKAMIQVYYYMLWLPSKTVCRKTVKPDTMLSFVNMWRAVYEVEEFLKKGYIVKAYVVGRYTKSKKSFKGQGVVKGASISDDKTVFNLTVDFNGKLLSVGGIDAKIEDIEAYDLYLVPLK